ncbi:MAG: hypothetical protein JOZ29_14455 [Deltaproteobacteria bacterium]|nr:hypothetical protein [Deltaproteobacteria bacterium]MBV8453450.1 hypothetical protein [Deltaproteobacteria bacterium]
MRAGPLLTDAGSLLTGTNYWKGAIVIIGAVFLIIMLITQSGPAARFEKEAKVAFSRAWQLLHEADKENRNVYPLPLSLAKLDPPRRLA